ncbi:hypothetical protein FRB90_002324 [Tulasnella sp. 427]|nr:hypothetical protein FRB90_002324 [Tulasnella sp. 427]
MSSARPLIFRGNDVEGFIKSIRRQAFQSDKLEDDQWIANYAATCLGGEAFKWYSSLEPEIRSNWRMLEEKLLERFTPPTEGVVEEAPVLPPLPQPTPRVGRVRIIAEDLTHSGYLDRELSIVNHQFMLTERPSQALSVKLEPVKGGFYRARATNAGSGEAFVGITWEEEPDISHGSAQYGYLPPDSKGPNPANTFIHINSSAAFAAVKEHLFYIKTPHESSSTWGKGPTQVDCWRETPEGRLIICYQKDGMAYPLDLASNGRRRLRVVADLAAYNEVHGGQWLKSYLVIEPL